MKWDEMRCDDDFVFLIFRSSRSFFSGNFYIYILHIHCPP